MSNIDKINTNRSKKKDKKIIAIKEIIQNHHTTSPKKVQIFLVEEYHMAISQRTLKRYMAKIKKEKKEQNPFGEIMVVCKLFGMHFGHMT